MNRPRPYERPAAERLTRAACVEPGCDRPSRVDDQRCVLHAARLGALVSQSEARPEPDAAPDSRVLEASSPPVVLSPEMGERQWEIASKRSLGSTVAMVLLTVGMLANLHAVIEGGFVGGWILLHLLGGLANLVLAFRLFGKGRPGTALLMLLFALLLVAPELIVAWLFLH